MPAVAAEPISTGPIRRPARSTVCPARRSSPIRRTLSPASTSIVGITMSSSVVVRSTWTTASAPLGSIAPVEMRIASPGPTVAADGRAGARLADDRQPSPRRAGAHGKAIHRAVVEARDRVESRRRQRPGHGRAPRGARPPRRRAGRSGRERSRAPRRSTASGHLRVPRKWYASRMSRQPVERRRPRPVADAPVGELADGEAVAKAWLMELMSATPLDAIGALPIGADGAPRPGRLRGAA